MSKIVAIGDIHGRDTWKKIVEKEQDADRVVFIGDYFDSFDIPAPEQLENFLDIRLYKKENPEKVVLLLGNHDFHYLKEGEGERYSGFNDEFKFEVKNSLDKVWADLMIVHVEDGHLFSHAGVTNTWLEETGVQYVEALNHEMKWEHLKFDRRDTSGYGNSPHQSPIWVRPQALIPDIHEKYVQVVGHTHQSHVAYYNGQYPARLIMIDCLDTVDQYLVVEGGKPRTESV